jgi:hypothetical protein
VITVVPDNRPGVVTITQPVPLTDPVLVLGLTAILRNSAEAAQRVNWVADTPVSQSLADLLEHLPPPRSGGGPGGALWRERHRYGGLYYRRGPGFISVRERRSQQEAAVFTLTAQALQCWRELSTPTTHLCPSCAGLEDERLVLRAGEFRVALPFRLRFPPTPFLAI